MSGKKIIIKVATLLVLSFVLLNFNLLTVSAATSVNIWWPSQNAHIEGTQPFKAMVAGLDISSYDMFWQVDGGMWNKMENNYSDYQHKEAAVTVSSWNWRGSGPYVVNFIASQNGSIMTERSIQIYTDTPPAIVVTTLPVVTVTQSPITQASDSSLYVDTHTSAATQAVLWRSSDPTQAAYMSLLAAQPTAQWFGNWNSNVENDVRALINSAGTKKTTPVLVAYNIPERDCGGFSSGGTNNPSSYKSWIDAFANGIGNAKAFVVLEPDALAQINCLSTEDKNIRLSLLSHAVTRLKQQPNTKVYLDAGHSNWIDAMSMASLLSQSGVQVANGFSLNVSNYMSTTNETTYGEEVSSLIGGKHFIIDTSRNGTDSHGEWCNPTHSAIGTKPTLSTGNTLIDAYLWLKVPGESDGNCNGGPSAGTWWPQYAVNLVKNASN